LSIESLVVLVIPLASALKKKPRLSLAFAGNKCGMDTYNEPHNGNEQDGYSDDTSNDTEVEKADEQQTLKRLLPLLHLPAEAAGV
jgi:hypothetical protein